MIGTENGGRSHPVKGYTPTQDDFAFVRDLARNLGVLSPPPKVIVRPVSVTFDAVPGGADIAP